MFGFADAVYISYYIRKNRISILWIDRVLEHSFFVFLFLRIFNGQTQMVADTEAVHSRFISRELPFIRNFLRFIYVYLAGRFARFCEVLLVKSADVITVVSDFDADYFRAIKCLHRRALIMRFSNVVDLDAYKDCKKEVYSVDHPLQVLLVGQFGNIYSPMDRAAKWISEDILPIVWERYPSLTLTIIGRRSEITQSHLACERILVLGEVKELMPYLRDATLTVVPLQFESGTRFKILESGAAALACVSTSLGAEGLDVTDGENILIADETESFATAIISVLSSLELQQKLGSNLHEFVKQNYSLQKQTEEGEIILKRLNSMCDA